MKKHIKDTCTLVFLVILFSLPNQLLASDIKNSTTNTEADQAFYTLADKYFDTYYFPMNPTTATQLGIHTYDDKLEDYSKANIDREITTLKKFEANVNAIKPKQLNDQTQSDRELVLNNIRSHLLTLQQIKPWEKNPDFYSSGITFATFVIIERQFASADDRLRALIAREKLMPAVLQEARRNLKNPPRIYTEIALEQLPGLIKFFQSDVPGAFADSHDPALSKQFAATNGDVIQALFDYQAWLKKDVLPHSNGDFRIGKDAFVKKLKYDEMVDVPLDK